MSLAASVPSPTRNGEVPEQSLLSIAVELAIEVSRSQPDGSWTQDDLLRWLREYHSTLLTITRKSDIAASLADVDWSTTINNLRIVCAVCQKGYRQLQAAHLRTHGLSPDAYRELLGMPKRYPLVCEDVRKAASRRARGRLAQQAQTQEPEMPPDLDTSPQIVVLEGEDRIYPVGAQVHIGGDPDETQDPASAELELVAHALDI